MAVLCLTTSTECRGTSMKRSAFARHRPLRDVAQRGRSVAVPNTRTKTPSPSTRARWQGGQPLLEGYGRLLDGYRRLLDGYRRLLDGNRRLDALEGDADAP